MSFLKNFKLSSDKKRLIENFIALSILQGANYIFPLITLPYLVRVLGPEKYGLIAFAQAFIQYFNILTDYGFNLSATREVSIHRDNKEKVSEIFSSVMIIKFALLILSFIIMTIIVFSFEKFRKDWLIYYLTFGMVVGQVLFPVWFFQGMEKMKYITILNSIVKLFSTMFIFVFIHSNSDYIYVPVLNSLGSCITGILALWIIFNKFNILFRIPKLLTIKYYLKLGWYVFISTVAISSYTISNTFILGLFTNNIIVGYYSAYEKIIRAFSNIFSPLFQSIYPYFIRIKLISRKKAKIFLNKLFIITAILTLLIYLLILLFSKKIIILMLGKAFLQYIHAFQLFSILIIVIPIAYIVFNIVLLSFKLDKIFLKIYIIGGLINIILLLFLVYILQLALYGAVISTIFTEISITIYAILLLRKYKILFS